MNLSIPQIQTWREKYDYSNWIDADWKLPRSLSDFVIYRIIIILHT
jgi:hypothetical protein